MRLISWIRAKISRSYYRLFHEPRYWRWLAARDAARSWVAFALLLLRESTRARREGVNTTVALVLRGLRSATLGAALGLATVVLDSAFQRATIAYARHNVSLFGWLLIRDVSASTAALALATTGLQVLAVLLGLYLTALGVVASGAYARVPVDVRDLVVREKVGSTAFRALSQACVFLVVAATAIVWGHPVGGFLLAGLSLVIGSAILAFVHLSLRIFDFFSPVALMPSVVAEFQRWAARSTSRAARHTSPQVIEQCRQRARRALRACADVGALLKDSTHVDWLQFFRLNRAALVRYAQLRLSIPSDSSWYGRSVRHPSWLTAQHALADFALRTGTSLEPEFVPDARWVEGSLLRNISLALERLQQGPLEPEKLNAAAVVAKRLAEDVLTLVHLFQSPTAHEAIAVLETSTRGARQRVHATATGDEISSSVTLCDCVGLSLVALALGTVEALTATTPSSLVETVRTINWRKSPTLYLRPQPSEVMLELERMFRSVSFERSVEQARVTAEWYVVEQMGRAYADHFARELDSVVELLDTLVLSPNPLEASPVVSAQLLLRGQEVVAKLLHRSNDIERAFEALSQLNLSRDYSWPSFDGGAFRARVEKRDRSLSRRLADLLPRLGALSHDDTLPDHFGMAYTKTAEELVLALTQRDLSLFKQLFPIFLAAVQITPARLLSAGRITNPTWLEAVLRDPFIDLSDISGLAVLIAELGYGDDFESATFASWDALLADDRNSPRLLDILSQLDSPSMFVVSPRSLARMRWKQEALALFPEVNMDDASEQEPSTANRRPLAAAFAPQMSVSIYELRDLFTIRYLLKRTDWGIREPNWRCRSLNREMNRAGEEGEG